MSQSSPEIETRAARPVIVDGVFFQLNNTGIARVWAELLRRWSAGPLGRRIVLLDRGKIPDDVRAAVTTIPFPPLEYAAWQQDRVLVQQICDERGADLFLSTYYTRPLSTASLLLLYDMIPERLFRDLSSPMWAQKHDAIRHAAAFASISHNTLTDLGAFFPHEARRPSMVAHIGISPAFRPADETEKAEFHQAFVQPYLGGRRYILFIGNPDSYKNGALLREALSRMDCSDLAVLFTLGSQSTTIGDFARIPGLIIHRADLSDRDLQQAYASAYCLVQASYYEGFGLPVIEAMACGCPVICSNTSAMPEVAGDAALFIDPSSPEDLVAALERVGHPDLRAELIARGLARAPSFSWDRCASILETFILEQSGTASATPPCRLCNGETRYWGQKLLLGRHLVTYSLCGDCGSLQTELPYWLDEAYSGHTTGLDTGACQRCFDLLLETTALLDLLGFPKSARGIDYGSGTGLYARMMRDRGYDFHAQDRYVTPYYMDGFSVEAIHADQYRLITAFEVVEHFPNPIQDLANLFGAGADLVLISTSLFTGQDETWPYLSPEAGQHVFFYSPKALASIAVAYGYRVFALRQVFMFVRESYAEDLTRNGINLDAVVGRMQDTAAYTEHAVGLLIAHQQNPYRQAGLDNMMLAAQRG